MNTYLISYDLTWPEDREDYKILIDFIKRYNRWAKPLQSVWLIKTDKTVTQVRDELRSRVENSDKLLIIKVTDSWASFNISKDVTDWMHQGF